MYLAVLGTHPELSIAELTAVYNHASRLNKEVARLATIPDLARIGGTIKVAQQWHELPTTDWDKVTDYLYTHLHQQLPQSGKVNVGVSVYGAKLNPRFLWQLKKVLRDHGLKVRMVVPKGNALTSAQIIHNGLDKPDGYELIIACGAETTALGSTIDIQDIESYGNRDQARPFRDAKVGMLPPKLAQIMINLTRVPHGGTILDPFCGTGVLLQEALIMGHPVVGSDKDPRMVEFSLKNLEWLKTNYSLPAHRVLEADATKFKWPTPINGVVCEGYLGIALRTRPSLEVVTKLQAEARELYLKFLKNIAGQLQAGTPLTIALPAWQTHKGLASVNIVDRLTDLGYTLIRYDLVYKRTASIVGRKLLLIKKV